MWKYSRQKIRSHLLKVYELVTVNSKNEYTLMDMHIHEAKSWDEQLTMLSCHLLWILGIVTLIPIYGSRHPSAIPWLVVFTYTYHKFLAGMANIYALLTYIEVVLPSHNPHVDFLQIHLYGDQQIYVDMWLPSRLHSLAILWVRQSSFVKSKTQVFKCLTGFLVFWWHQNEWTFLLMSLVVSQVFPVGGIWIAVATITALTEGDIEIGFLTLGLALVWPLTDTLLREWQYIPQNMNRVLRLWCRLLVFLGVATQDYHALYQLFQEDDRRLIRLRPPPLFDRWCESTFYTCLKVYTPGDFRMTALFMRSHKFLIIFSLAMICILIYSRVELFTLTSNLEELLTFLLDAVIKCLTK